MLINRHALDKQLKKLTLFPTLLCCLLLTCIYLIVEYSGEKNRKSARNEFIRALYSDQQSISQENFNLISKALLQTKSIYSIALIDSSGKTVYSEGVPVNEAVELEKIDTKDSFWLKNGKLNTLLSLPMKNKLGRGGENQTFYLFYSAPNQFNTVRHLKNILIICFVMGLITLICNKFKNSIANLLSIDIKAADSILNQLELGQYGYKINTSEPNIYSPLIERLNSLSQKVYHSNDNLQKNLDQSYLELRETLETVEVQNIELDIERKRAVEANQAKSDFLANTSHEIRTPINGLIGFSSLLRKTPLNDKQSEYLDTIEESAKILQQNINDIIDYSRLEIGTLNLDYKPVHIRNLIDEAQRYILSVHPDQEEVNLSTYFDNSTPPKLLGDPMRIKQIYSSLVSNAIELSGNKSVSSHIDTEQREDNKVNLKISIKTVKGNFDKDAVKSLQKLVSNHNTLTNHIAETKNQMGLINARGLVKRMHGQIGLSTDDDQLIFWFTILLGQTSIATKKSHVTNQSEISILVVDDNASNLRLVAELLRDMKVAVEGASSGKHAIKLFRENNYDLVLMDIQMPEMDGFETTSRIRELEKDGSRTPITALTAHAVEEEKSVLLKSGMDDFLSKPVGETELRELLTRWTGHSPAVRKINKPSNTKESEGNTSSLNSPVNLELSIELSKGKLDLAKDMLKMLLESIETDFEFMHTLWNTAKHEELHDLVHKIHGGACYCGVPNLLATSSVLDKKLKDKQFDCKDSFDSFCQSCENLIDWKKENNLDELFTEKA